MKRNMGTADRLIRFILAIFLFLLAYWKSSWILFAIGLFVLFESAYGWCLMYQILGKNSCPRK